MKSLTIKAVILCAGSGARTALPYNKILHYFGEKTCIEHCIDAFNAAGIDDILLVITQKDEKQIREILPSYPFCYGGETRFDSVKNALKHIDDCDMVVIHDGARPFVTPEIITAAVESAKKYGSGVAAVESIDTVKTAKNGIISSHPKRNESFLIQTPQAFDFALLSKAYNTAQGEFTDDSEVFQITGKNIHLSQGDYKNKKITRPEDLFVLPNNACVGIGFDVHPLTNGNAISLGGIKIPCEFRLVGHSDADVLIHAIMDSLLSAAGLPDIGVIFPDSDDKYLGIDSMILLDKVISLINKKVLSISCVVIAQKPKIAAYIPEIRKNIAVALKSNIDSINVSATTTEHLGIIGEGKAIAASALTLLGN